MKVNMHCQTCKTDVLKAVTNVLGIDEVSVDLEKQILVVIGDVDPVCVVARVRKIGKIAEIISVGPSKKPDVEKPKPKVPEPCPIPCLDSCCQILYPHPGFINDFQPIVIGGYPQSCDNGGCFILWYELGAIYVCLM